MSFIKEKLAQQKLLKVVNTFKEIVEVQDKQIKDLQDRLENVEKLLILMNKKDDSTDSNTREEI